jgi:hypothetical protein
LLVVARAHPLVIKAEQVAPVAPVVIELTLDLLLLLVLLLL